MSYYETTTSEKLAKTITSDINSIGGYMYRGSKWTGLNFQQTILSCDGNSDGDLDHNLTLLNQTKEGTVIVYFFDGCNGSEEETWRKLHNGVWERIFYASVNHQDGSQNVFWDLNDELKEKEERAERSKKARSDAAAFKAADDRFAALSALKK